MTTQATRARSLLSVFVITKNEADRLPVALASVKDIADELIVVDSGSTDGTCGIAEALGAKVYHRAWTGYGEQKIFGESQCSHHWVLNIDADEALDEPLQQAIRDLLSSDTIDLHAGYRLTVTPLYNERSNRFSSYQHPVRLYNRNRAGFSDSPVHDSVIVREGSIGTLRGQILHRTFRSIAHHLEKLNQYSSDQALDRFLKGRCPSRTMIVLSLPANFLKYYILRRNFLLGVDGFIVSCINAFWRFTRLAKTRELCQQGKHGQAEADRKKAKGL
jgi:glycosyltransferase involved in cell wall biosynthesis